MLKIIFLHYYNIFTNEVVGMYQGQAFFQLSVKKGKIVQVEAKDIIIIPVGVGHKQISSNKIKL